MSYNYQCQYTINGILSLCKYLAGTRSAPTQKYVGGEQADGEPESASVEAKSETKEQNDTLSEREPELIADVDGEKGLPGSRESPNKSEVELA